MDLEIIQQMDLNHACYVNKENTRMVMNSVNASHVQKTKLLDIWALLIVNTVLMQVSYKAVAGIIQNHIAGRSFCK